MTRLLLTTCQLLLIISVCHLLCLYQCKLVQVVSVFRNGHRSPFKLFPQNDRPESAWPDGLAALTNQGKLSLRQLGQFLRNRYFNFLGDRYDPLRLYVRSSNTSRTIASAQALLSGLMPQTGAEKPIPVDTKPIRIDSMLRPRGCRCQRIKKLYMETKHSKEMKLAEKANAELLNKLKTKFGAHQSLGISLVYRVFDKLMAEREANLERPSFITDSDVQRIEEMMKVILRVHASTDELIRLEVGVLLDDILKGAEKFFLKCSVTSSDSENVPFRLFSGHDMTIVNLLASLGIKDVEWPNFGACILFELHRDEVGEFFFRVFYRNGTEPDSPAFRLPLTLCGLEDCPRSKMLALLADYHVKEHRFWDLCW